MRTRLVSGLGVILLLAGCGGPRTPRLEPLPADAVLLSYAAGPNAQADLFRDQRIDEVLGTSLGVRVVQRGVPGELSESALQRLPGVLDDVKPALMVLGYGAADFAQGKDRAALKANLAAMIDLARARRVQVAMLGMPNLALGVSLKADPLYAEVAREKNVPIENEALEHVLSRRSLKAYTMVPNEQGIVKLGQAVRDLLIKAGAVRQPGQ